MATPEGQLEADTPLDQRQQATQVRMVLTIVFLAFLGQMTLNPVISPLSREVHLHEWQVGLTISAAAMMLVLCSQYWGRLSQSRGRKPVLVGAMTVLTLSMVIFAVICWAGMNGLIGSPWLFIFFVLCRGILFGSALSAVIPTAQAFIANTTTEAARVKGMAGIGAVQGIAMIAGSVTGGLLASFGLLFSIGAVPVILLVGLMLAAWGLRPEDKTVLIPDPPRISPLDRRVAPFLVVGFGIFTAMSFIQFLIGFLIQDRFGLSGSETGLQTGVVLLLSGICMVFIQGVVVPRTKWAPTTLLRVGTAVALIGSIALLIHGPYWFLLISTTLIMGGIGIVMPGYTAGPSLLMTKEEQGGLAGLIGATNGLAFVVSPTLGTTLYGIWPNLPIVIGGVILFLVLLLVLLHPRFTHMPNPYADK